MKKLIAASSAFMIIGFAVALANADESTVSKKSIDETTEQGQQAGIAGSSDKTPSSISTDTTSTHSTTTTTADTGSWTAGKRLRPARMRVA
jgi:hypothetical protein